MEKEKKETFFNLSELTASWCGNAKKIATWYIDTSEKLAKDALSFQERSASWANDTPLAAVFETQKAIAQQLVENSAGFVRKLWRVDSKNGERAEA